MTELEGSGGGTVGWLWRKHGGGYYALLAIGTFIVLEVQAIAESAGAATGVQDFIQSELLGLGWETMMNTFFASIWPWIWIDRLGFQTTVIAVGGGYAVWAVLIAIALARREKAFRKELGL